MQERGARSWLIAFALIYFTFFLDNVLLTVLVPIIPDWVRGESLALWATHAAPLALVLNSTHQHLADQDKPGIGWAQAGVGAVLSAKALTQLCCAGPAAAAVCRRGPARVLRAGTALLLLAAAVFAACSWAGGSGGAWVWAGAGCGRAAQGAGAALGGVAGLALAARAAPAALAQRALGALLGAVALGVLVGYPFGGVTFALGSRTAPFLIIAVALLANLGLQYMFLDTEEYNEISGEEVEGGGGVLSALGAARGEGAGSAGACAGAVLLTTSVMAALEPCLPLWIMDKFHPQKWVSGVVFVPDSLAYLVSASVGGAAARAWGAERVALCAQVCVGGGALLVPTARSVPRLVAPHAALGAGLGALDAALLPALLARRPARAPHAAALLQAAGAAAYALGPLAGGALAAAAGFETTMRALAVANLLYVAYLYRALARDPLSHQWGARSPQDDEPSSGAEMPTATLPHTRYDTFNVSTLPATSYSAMACTKPLGPGPGAYRLPTTVGYSLHDPSRARCPMYSFGTNARHRVRPLGPGPAYRIERVTRDGLVTSPAWSLGAALPARAAARTPGPAAHAPERCPPMREARAPQYSMGARLAFRLKRIGPAPNAYALRLGPGTPAYTMGARVGFNAKAKSPGPAVYFQRDTDVYRTKQAQYSLGARLGGAGRPTRSPGPAAYPPNLYNVKKNPYAYSFGTKHAVHACPMIIQEDTMDCL